jgi:hypothetical protein
MNIEMVELDRERIIEAIATLDATDLKSSSISELEKVITPLFTGLLIQAPRYQPGVNIFRGRICEKPPMFSDLIYPPAASVAEYGRLTDIGETMFYGATTKAAPFFELKPATGECVAISKWRSNDRMVLNHIGFTEDVTVMLNSNRDLSKIYEFVKESHNFSDLNSYVHNYLASTFTQRVPKEQSYLYKLTIALGRKLLGGEVIHGLLFPTIAMSANVDNVVLKAPYFDSKMDFVSCEYLRVDEAGDSNFRYTTLDTATKIAIDGSIAWSGRSFKWEVPAGNQLTFKAIGNEWVAFDENDDRVDPE